MLNRIVVDASAATLRLHQWWVIAVAMSVAG
jgi:hypothetical protein